VTDLLCYQPDVLPTLTELAGAATPADVDGISLLPEILGEEAVGRPQQKHEMLYWEYGRQVAVRRGDWKAVQPKGDGRWELYNLGKDLSERTNVASRHPEVLETMRAFAQAEHVPVEAGTYRDRTHHERDRWAKWGTTRAPAPKKAGKTQRLEGRGLVPVKEMTLVSFSSENRGNDRPARYALDGNPATVWHSQFSGGLKKHPHELVIDLGRARSITGFRYLARQDGGWNGAFAKTEFFVADSRDGFADEAVAVTTFTRKKEAQAVDLTKPVRGRFVKIRVLSEVNGKDWASAAEVGIVEKD
jgi:hypothetical protein